MTCAPMRFSMTPASFGPTPGSTVVAANRPKISVGRFGMHAGLSGRRSVQNTAISGEHDKIMTGCKHPIRRRVVPMT